MRKNLLLLSSIFLIIFSSLTQKTCGFDEIHKELLKARPEFKEKIESSELKFQEFIKNAPKRSGVYKIPIVVHVMETGTNLTSITDQQIKNAIKELNEKYRKLPNTPGFGNGVDVTIEFSLAVRDPNGKCTNGINRFNMSGVSNYVTNGVKNKTLGITDSELKSYISWNQTKYYNVWLVSEIENNEGGGGTQGYAYFSDSHGDSWDGAVILVNAFKDANNNTFPHELGHAFNLYHSFEGDLDASGNSICPDNSDCTSKGDRVCDTPPHKRTNGNCVSGTNACDNNSSNDKYMHNYMDYSSDECATEFTSGQKVRMLAALTVNRGSFLEANGNLALVPVTESTLDFICSKEYVCTGTSVTLYDQSTCIPNTYINGGPWASISYSWTLTSGATVLTSTAQTPSFTLSTPGTYDITLEITTVLGTKTITKQGALIVGASPKTACTPTTTNAGNFWQTVSNVVFNTMNNGTSTYVNNAYQNFACEKSTVVAPNTTYPLSISLRATDYAEAVEAYIDYNNNGVFDAAELIYSGSIVANSTNTLSTTITIPSNATLDQPLRMRIIGEAGTISSGERSCSSNYFVGDVEDYTVYISSKVAKVAISVAPSATITYGNTVNFTASVSNQGTSPIYNWYVNDVKIDGATGTTFSSSSLLDGDKVKCELVSNLQGVVNSPATSNTIVMNVTGTPLSDFTASKRYSCTGTSIAFNDLTKLSPTSWNWSFEGGTPSTSTSQNPSVTYSTEGTYAVTLTASNSNGTGTTTTKTAFIKVYATPTNTCSSITRSKSPAVGIGITSFNFNDIVNNTIYNDAVYQDFTCSKTTFLTTGASYPVSVSTGSSNDQWLRIYIDYNGDNDFNDAGEIVFSPANGKSLFSGTITTPTTVTKDKILRMRVITDFLNTSPGNCKSLEYGQAEDYGIVFRSSACENIISPTFTAVNSVCEGGVIESLPTTSLNGINGMWSPAINNTTSTTYTFTPTSGQCASTASMTITVTPKVTPTFNGVNAICSGENLVALPTTSNNSISGSWSPSLNNLQTTTYTFTPNSNQCGNTTTMTITVNSIPDAGIISGVEEICLGDETTFTSTVSGGIWSVSNENVATIDQNGTLTSNMADSLLINYSVTSINGCNSNVFKSINILSSQTLTELNGLNSVCVGSTINLSASAEGGIWHSSNDSKAIISNGIVTGIATGTSTISYSIGSGNCYSEITKLITIETAPIVTISGPSKICWNGRAMMRASVAGGIWGVENSALLLASPQGLFRNSVKPAIDNFKSGVNYTVKSRLGACSSKAIKNVYVRNVTAPNITISATKTSIQVNEITAAAAATSITSVGTWSSTNTVVSASANLSNTKTAAVKGLRVGAGANVVYFAEHTTTGCRQAGYLAFGVTAAASLVDVNTTQSSNSENIHLYPNPSNGKFTLENTEGATSVKLVDLTGRVITTQPIVTGTTTVDFSGVATGKYMVHISGDNFNEVQPIVIE
jgi:hypothetical protein